MDTLKSPAAVLVSPDQADLWRRINETAGSGATTPGELLREVCGRQPDRPAVIAGRRNLSYAELIGAAEAVAGQLRAAGVGAGDSVLICVEPGWEQVVAVAGVLIGGFRWSAVNPAAPQSARWGQLADAGGRAVLTQTWLEERLRWPEGTPRMSLDDIVSQAGDDPGAPSDPVGNPADVACLLQAPDGAWLPVTHDGLATPVTDLVERFGLGRDDRLLAVCPLGDDVSLSANLCMLLAGGAVVVPDDIDLRTPAAWVDLMRQHRITVWHSPPTLAALLVEHLHQRGDDHPEDLRLVMLGGEPFPLSLAVWLRRVLGDRPRLVNLGPGGIAGLWSTCHELDTPDPRRGHVPIGAPLHAAKAYILSDALVPCPTWVNGRLYVGGRMVAAQPVPADLAAVLADTGETVYRTDYIGRLLPAGLLDLGGEDGTRIAVSGHSFNMRDIEAALATHSEVLLAAAVRAGEGSVAFVKTAPGGQATGAQLLDHLRTKMSPYLLPDRIELVGSFPLSPAGRIDRAALAARAAPPAESDPAQAAPGASGAGDELIQRACALAARILDISDVEPSMNLFDVGATSVQLVRMAVQAEVELGIQVSVEELLRFPSVNVLVSFARTQTRLSDDESDVGALEASAEAGIILDPVERTAFKDRRPGVRHELSTSPGIDLSPGADALRLARRRTYRRFSMETVPQHGLAVLLSHLRRLDEPAAEPKYAYPSAGSLYPIQTYLTVAAGRVEGIDEGAYYYHPESHRLVTLEQGARVEAAAHAWINRAAFRESAFSLYLVADQEAIAPMYGSRARDYSLLEAGGMCQLLMGAAVDCGLGLCPVGEMDDSRLRGPLRLGDQHLLVHALLGGMPQEHETHAAQEQMLARVTTLGLSELDPS